MSLFYYNQQKDTDQNGNVLCSAQGLTEVKREINFSKTPIQDTIKLLIEGGLTQQEKEKGLTTEFPLEGLKLEGASLNEGVLTLEFSDPQNRTSGGSCRANILRLQVEQTALQFEEVNEVQFKPETLFQP